MPHTARESTAGDASVIDRMSRRISRIGFVFVCVVLTASCNASKNGVFIEDLKEFEILIHPDAVDIERDYHLRIRNLKEYRYWSVKYNVNVTYPETAVDEGRRAALHDRGWVKCEGRSDPWRGSVDTLRGSNRTCRFQRLDHLAKGKLLVSIQHSYTDQYSEEVPNCPETPTNTLQEVLIVFSEPYDMEKVIKRRGLTCEP